MSSPFSTIEEFNNVLDGPTEGAIYTFAGSPLINNIALLAAVGIFIWFIVKTYSPHASPSRIDKSMNHLSSFIIVGLLSLVTAHHPYAKQQPATVESRERSELQSNNAPTSFQAMSAKSNWRQLPLGLLGVINVGLPAFSQLGRRLKYQRKSRSFYRSRKSKSRASRNRF
ncbi:MAG: hypothetical protein AAFQ63_10090 [Cyanobacteria bacterium J06621_11]